MSGSNRPVALLLPGQGAQHPGMAVELYGRVRVFTATMDEFFGLLGAEGARLREDWLAEKPAIPIDDASRAQPLLFAVEYAIGRTLLDHGVRPAALLGHSIGELAAAALAGVFDLADGARVLAARTAALAEVPPGGMLAFAAGQDELLPYLGTTDHPDAVVIGAVNAPRQTVLAGPEPQLSAVARALAEADLHGRPVRARQPFHSPAAAAAAKRFEAVFHEIDLHPPTVPVFSSRTAARVSPEQATDPAFWATQLAEPVLFWPALDALLAAGGFTLVETGPGRGLSLIARRHPAVRQGGSAVLSLFPSGAEGTERSFSAALDQLAARVAVR